MNIQLKRRLIVAIIILALVVIFVPMLFKQNQSYYPHNVVITTPAIPPQQPQLTHQRQDADQLNDQQPMAQSDNQQEVSKNVQTVGTESVKKLKQIVEKPKVMQTPIKVTKIKFTQPKAIFAKLKLPSKSKFKPKLNAKAYVIQLGVFSNNAYAGKLIHSLRNKGFTSFGYKQKRKGNVILTYVYVGPLVTRKCAEQKVDQLQKIMKLKGAVVPFNATKLY